MLLEGQQIGHYRLLQLLGSGGMGTVYLASDLSIRRQVAIKLVRTESALYPDNAAAIEAAHLFRREANAVAMLDHPNILPLFDYGEQSLNGATLTYMVMPFRQEGSLADWLRRPGISQRLSPQDVAFLIHQAASALQYAHDHNIIHRDVKPSNFLIRSRPENPTRPDLLLADFGIAKFSTALSSAETMPRGTPTYMPPEQWEDHPVLATDQYALAAMTYELLTGRTPFQGNHGQLMYQHFHTQPSPPGSINPRLSNDIDAVVLRALAKNPKNRFPSITSFDQAFQQALRNINNIHIILTINEMEAINGISRTITLPDGRPVTVAVPAGAYDGQIIQLEGQGKPSNYSELAGALIIKIAISRVEATVASLLNSNAIETTLPELDMHNNEMPVHHRRGFSKGMLMLLTFTLLLIAGSVGLFFVNMARQPANAQPGTTATAQANLTATSDSATAKAQMTGTALANATATAQAPINATATAQAQINATATAQAQETATAIVGMTATAEAQASATAGPLETATAGTPVYQDALNNANNPNTVAENWDQNSNCYFAADGYHVIEGSHLHGCKESVFNYQNAAITVDVQILSGQTGGLFFHIGTNIFNEYAGYLFEIDSAGRYRISASDNYSRSSATLLKDWTTSPALRKGNSVTNTLQVIAQGSNLSFYANGVFLVQLTDTTYTSGVVAFLATSNGTTTADVVYSNLKVFQMS
jgi:eukaryotic-like serine/threonine-protein kinase